MATITEVVVAEAITQFVDPLSAQVDALSFYLPRDTSLCFWRYFSKIIWPKALFLNLKRFEIVAVLQISNDSQISIISFTQLFSLVLHLTHLYKYVSCYSEVGLFHCMNPLHQFLGHSNKVLVQQESEDCIVSWEKFQSANTVQ